VVRREGFMSTTLTPEVTTEVGGREKRWRGLWITALVIAAAVAGVGSMLMSGSGDPPKLLGNGDFETGDLTEWTEESFVSGSFGGWFVYEDGLTPPTNDVRVYDYNVFQVSDPPQGRYAAVTDGNGAGLRMLHQDFDVDGPSVLHATVFYWTEFSPLGFDRETRIIAPNELLTGVPNQQFRIDLIDPAADIKSLDDGDVLGTVFRTVEGDPVSLEPTEVTFDLSGLNGQTIRLRLAEVDNRGRFFAGIDNVRIEATD
jgi:hypothetical protein